MKTSTFGKCWRLVLRTMTATQYRMFSVNNPWSRSRIIAGFIFTSAILLIVSFSVIDYNSWPRLAYASTSLKHTIPRTTRGYNRLQPLIDMFYNASKGKVLNEQRQTSALGDKWPSVAHSTLNMSSLQEVDNKVSVLLLLIVTTAPSRFDRREAIRATWWKNCDGAEVMCKFFTDGLQLTKELQKNLSAEQKIRRDIEFMPFEETRIFGIRFLYQIMWAKAKYEFKFMLHMDDDYFLCLEKLKSELYHRPKKSLVWGSYHCSFKDIIYVDEAWIIFSSDVIEQFLSQDPQTILCHPHSDQQIAVWLSTLYGSKKSLIEFHDGRLHHYPPARKLDKFKNLPQVCDNFLGVHGSSPEMIKKFGRNSADRRRILKLPKLTRITETCHFPNVFNISKVAGMYQFDLRPCITNPRWTPGEGMWRGSQ